MKFEYPINFPRFVLGSELYFTQLSHRKQMGLYPAAFRPEHTYIVRGRAAHGCPRQRWKRSCRGAAGPRYALAHQASGQLSLALAQPRAPGTAALGLAGGFAPKDGSSGVCMMVSSRMAALGLAGGFSSKDGSSGACRRASLQGWQLFSPSMAALRLAGGFPPAWWLWDLHDGFLPEHGSSGSTGGFPPQGWQLWGLEEGFPQHGSSRADRRVFSPSVTALGVARGFSSKDSSSGAGRRVFPGCRSTQWGHCSSTRTSLGVLTWHRITLCSFIFLF